MRANNPWVTVFKDKLFNCGCKLWVEMSLYSRFCEVDIPLMPTEQLF